jgi:hypothetical protein
MRLRRLAPPAGLIAAIVAISIVPATTSADPPSECRDVVCAGSVQVGRNPVVWSSPQLFYPNNEDIFANPSVGGQALSEVRQYGPALCRHRFFGAGMVVVVKACAPQTPVRVRAQRLKRGGRKLDVSYSARPMLGGEGELVATGTIYEGLKQITGLVGG